ncbi:MAG: EutN/CcmL family microcompartment protein [Thermoplasmata archaeon]
MLIARVIGNVVATIKTPSHDKQKLMVVEPLNPDGTPQGGSLIAVDAGQAGIGDYVLVMTEGNSNRQLVNRKDGAIDAVIVGVIDYIEREGKQYRLQDIIGRVGKKEKEKAV